MTKLTTKEYEKLQTLPLGYTKGISNSERFKCIGNGWTIEVIKHLFTHLLKEQDKNKKWKST